MKLSPGKLSFSLTLLALMAISINDRVVAQDVDYGNLSLGIYGSPGNNAPELMFATRAGGHVTDARFYYIHANPKALFMKTLASPYPIYSMYHDARVGSLSLHKDGVGVGTTEPGETFHVYSSDRTDIGFGEARVLIENDKSDRALRTMLELVNNGPSRFELNNTDSGQTWAFQTNNSDSFMINRLGSGGNEFSIRKTGMVTMGPAGSMNFILHPNGNLDLNGTLSQLSDRNAKKDIRPVDTADILNKISELPIATWQYKDDKATVRHIGPMAQDFRKSFGLGQNDTSIATVDIDGVALAAIQALKKENDELYELVDDLQQRMSQLESSTTRR